MSDPLGALADLLDPPEIDVFGLLGYTPTAKQQEFHDATEFDVLYGGAAGGGKTRALLMDDLRDAVRYPGIRIGAFRRTYDELKESLLKELATVDFARELGAKWNGTERELTFPNRSIIRYRYLETIQDATRRQGGEYQKVTLDERTLIPPEAVSIVVEERIRSGRADLPVIGVRSGTNPGGIGHASVKTRYIDATDHGAHVVIDEQGRSVRFIQAKVDDNPHVDAGYKRRLDGIADPSRRAAMRDGDWDQFAGQMFAEWRHARHVVRPFPIPREWERRSGIDYGLSAPWSVHWGALDNDRRVWLYREEYASGVGEREQARRIKAAETGESVRIRAADPSMWSKVGDANPIAQTYSTEGVALTKATNDRIAGVARVHTFLGEAPLCPHHELERHEGRWDEATCPRLHVFSSCTELIRTLPYLPRDPKKPEDVDTDAEDHAYDSLRYLLMTLSVRDAQPPKRPPADSSEAFHADVRKQMKARKRASARPIGV